MQAAVKGKCEKKDDQSCNFIYSSHQCRAGGECPKINDENHNREFEHPIIAQMEANVRIKRQNI
jgi:hypothetical protein